MKNVLLLLAVAFCSTVFSQTKTVTFKPDTKTGQDAFIVTDYGCIRTGETVATDDKNFGDRIELDMAGWTVSAAGCGNMTNRSLLKFNELSTIPQGAVIVSAELKLYGVSSSSSSNGNSGSNQFHILRVTKDWDEQTVTWNTQPTTTTENQIAIPQTASGWNWNLTNSSDNLVAMVQDMVSNPETNFGFMFKLDTEDPYRRVTFASSEHPDSTLRPELIVTYEYDEYAVPGCTDRCAENYNPQATKDDGNCIYKRIDEPTKTVTFKPDAKKGQDARIYTNYGCTLSGNTKPTADMNFGNATELEAAAWTFNAIGCSEGALRALLKFVELSTIPQGAVIVSAELKLYGVPSSSSLYGNSIFPGSPYSDQGSNQSSILRVTSDWDDQTVTWNTQPTTTTDNQISIPQTTSRWNWDFINSSDNLVAMVQDMVSNPETNFGFMIKLDTERYYRSVIFASSNHGNPALHPELIVTYKYVVPGCTDRYAENYNPQATKDDCSCIYKRIDEPVIGCMDSTALNYNPVATVAGDDACIYEFVNQIYGCTDPKALNYNPEATDYDHSKEECRCIYADEENTFPPVEIPETPEDTLGTWAVEECWFTAANIISAKIVKLTVSDIDESGNNHGKNKPPHLHAYAEWEIIRELGGENNSRIDTIRERIQYCIDGKNSSIDNQPTLFYMSVVCKNPLYVRSGKDTPEVVGYTFSAFAYLRSGFSTDISQPVAESKNNVAVYPNPFSDKLTVLVKGAKTADIALYSIDGNLLATYRNLNEVEIATSKLPAGVYVVKVTVGGKKESVTVVKK